MAHVFVAPHPDDVALSCGGLIAGLRELGQNITILTVFCGEPTGSPLTPYQREALGFGTKTIWPVTEAFNRPSIRADYPPHLDLPDAVFRGYEGDEQLLGTPREDDPAPTDILRREIARLEPQKVYFPLGVGGHVDHQLARRAGIALLAESRRWVMPGPDYTGI